MRLVAVLLVLGGVAFPQSTATVAGHAVDPSGARIAEARARISNALTGFAAEAAATDDGAFRFTNLPFQNYEVTVRAPGFAPWTGKASAWTPVPVVLEARLVVAADVRGVTVSADTAPLVDPERTGSYAQINRADIERLAVGGNRGLEAVLESFPGFAQNANGAIHPRGAHNQMTFVVDGMPVSDQLTGAFANAIDPNMVQTVELYTGNIPAEYGSKVAAVANITTRGGLGSGRPIAGSVSATSGGFDTLSSVAHVSGEVGRIGYSGMAHSMRTHRYLDAVSLDNLHNGGHSNRGFARMDVQASARDIVRFNVSGGASSFELANLRSQQAAGMDARQRLDDASVSAGWVRTLSPVATYEAMLSWRQSTARLTPSEADFPVRASQDRGLGSVFTSHSVSRIRGAHQLRAGFTFQRFPVRERFTLRVTDWPDAPEHLDPWRARPFVFDERAAGTLTSGWMQDQVRWGRFQFSLGLRHDVYRFLARGSQLQPRVGMSFHLRETGTVLRASYNRTYQTPPNENLLVSNSPGSAALTPPSVREALGGAFVTIRPERQNFLEAGVQQAIGKWASVQAAYYHKHATDQQDNNSFFNTPIVFPTSLARIRVNGFEGRVVVPERRGLSGTLSWTHARAVSTPPFTGGLFIGNDAVTALSSGPFVIDHDQKLSMHGVVFYRHRRGWFGTLSLRHDSGLVINPSDPEVVAADPDYADLLPYIDLAGTPARSRPRTITGASAGYRRVRDDRSRWEVAVDVINASNATAVYTFQSLFAGTRLVQPRTASVRLAWFF